MPDAIISTDSTPSPDAAARFSATGQSFAIREWRGSGPAKLHIHRSDDEAWHVLEGTLRFRFADRTADVNAGNTVFVPAGVAHTYEAIEARYLVFLTPRLVSLIEELQRSGGRGDQGAIYEKHESDLLE